MKYIHKKMRIHLYHLLLPDGYENASSTKKSQIRIANGLAYIFLMGGVLGMTINILNHQHQMFSVYLCFDICLPFVIYLNFIKKDKLARVLLAFYPGLSYFLAFMVNGGILYGDRQNYFLVLMLASMLPMLLFSDTDEKPFFAFGCLYYALIIAVFDLFLLFEHQTETITFETKLKELMFYSILVSGFALKLKQRTEIENDLKIKNIDLAKQRNEIQSLLGVVQEQKEEVIIQQETLASQNVELSLQKKELVSINSRIGKNIEALLKLVSEHVLTNGNYTEALKIITKVSAQTLNVSRVSIWEINEQNTSIICVDMHTLSSELHTCGQELFARDYPIYFNAVTANKTIVAEDAMKNAYTSEFKDGYLIPLQIASMLDSPYFVEGKLRGIICFEQQNEMRNWAQEDVFFSRAVADLIPLAHECALRKDMQSKIILQNELLEEKVKRRTAELEKRNAQLEEYAFYNAHVLRAPLCSLQGLIDLAQADKDFKIDEQYLAHFKTALTEMSKVTKDVSEKLRASGLE